MPIFALSFIFFQHLKKQFWQIKIENQLTINKYFAYL